MMPMEIISPGTDCRGFWEVFGSNHALTNTDNLSLMPIALDKVIICQQRINCGLLMSLLPRSNVILKRYGMSGYRHTTISLICMSTHKATAARCLSYHQAASGQPAIRALATAPLRRLALSMLYTTTIATNSYQTTCTVSERTFNKRQDMQDME